MTSFRKLASLILLIDVVFHYLFEGLVGTRTILYEGSVRPPHVLQFELGAAFGLEDLSDHSRSSDIFRGLLKHLKQIPGDHLASVLVSFVSLMGFNHLQQRKRRKETGGEKKRKEGQGKVRKLEEKRKENQVKQVQEFPFPFSLSFLFPFFSLRNASVFFLSFLS